MNGLYYRGKYRRDRDFGTTHDAIMLKGAVSQNYQNSNSESRHQIKIRKIEITQQIQEETRMNTPEEG